LCQVEEVPRLVKALLLCCIASLAACVSARVWDKPGATPALAEADFADCRRLVLDEMWLLGWERNWPPRFYDPQYMPPYYRSQHPFWLDFATSPERELAMVDFCMHSKGYRLQKLPE
jgi:hypothetical protein